MEMLTLEVCKLIPTGISLLPFGKECVAVSSRRVVIIGGVAGGATLAARLRRVDEHAEIILLERGEHISFANCGLPYHIGRVVPEHSSLFVASPQTLYARYRIDVRPGHEAVRIHRDTQEVEVCDLNTGSTYMLNCDHLVLATGAEPIRPPIPGADLDQVFTLRTIPDMKRIITAADRHPDGQAVVVGAGFIGLEVAENLHRRGLKVTLVEMMDQVLPRRLDREMAALVHHHLRSQGIDLRLRQQVSGFFARESGGLNVELGSGDVLRASMAVMAVGIRPEAKLAAEAGLNLGLQGGVLVDDQLLTSDPHISAIGDVAEVPALAGGTTWVPLAGPANRQGRLAADQIGGLPVRYSGVQGTGIVKIFDLTAAFTGKTEAMLRREGGPFHSIVVWPASHARYYPGSSQMALKLHFGPKGDLLGAQAVGASGVDKRIDVIATALRLGATVDDLAALELCYAPPYSTPKDPVNIAGYAAGNVIRGEQVVTWRDVMERDPVTTVLLDVREPAERLQDRIPDSLHIPLGQLRNRLDELPEGKKIIVYCAVGLRAHIAVRILEQNGFRAANMTGGMRLYAPIRDDLKLVGA